MLIGLRSAVSCMVLAFLCWSPSFSGELTVPEKAGLSRFLELMHSYKNMFSAIAEKARDNPEFPHIEDRLKKSYEAIEGNDGNSTLPSHVADSLISLGKVNPTNGNTQIYFSSKWIVRALALGLNAPWEKGATSKTDIWECLDNHVSPAYLRSNMPLLLSYALQKRRQLRTHYEQKLGFAPTSDRILRVMARTDTFEVKEFAQEEVKGRDKMHKYELEEATLWLESMRSKMEDSDFRILKERKLFEVRKDEVPPVVRARLWDDELMLSILNAFWAIDRNEEMEEDQDDVERILRLTRSLGEIGSPECAYALAKSLRHPLVVYEHRMNAKRSLRIYIMEALGRIYPTEPLFNEQLHADLDKRGLSDEQIDEFYRKREEWAEEHFHIEWRQKRPEPFIGYPMPQP